MKFKRCDGNFMTSHLIKYGGKKYVVFEREEYRFAFCFFNTAH